MHGLKKKLFDGQRLRIDRVHPALAIAFVIVAMLGQRVALDQLQPEAPKSRVAATIDVASTPSRIAKAFKPATKPDWAGIIR